QYVDACGRESCLQRSFDHVPRDPRVLADQHGRVLDVSGEHLAGRVAQAQQEVGCHRALPDGAAYSVRSEIAPGHCARIACQTASASLVSDTSWTRSICAPRCAASSAAPRLAASRSPTGFPVMTPSVDLRESPATTATPSELNSSRRRSSSRLCAGVLP